MGVVYSVRKQAPQKLNLCPNKYHEESQQLSIWS